MKRVAFVLLMIITSITGVPSSVHASTLVTTSVSSSNTGGITVGSSEKVVSNSSSEASVRVVNTINANNSGGSATIIVDTNQNGTTTHEEKTHTFAPGEPVSITASASVHATGTPVIEAEFSTSTTGVNSDIATSAISRSGLVQVFVSFFQSIFSFFR